MRLYARITSPHPIPAAVLVSHIESQVTREKPCGEPGPHVPGGARGGQHVSQQGRMVRDWMESSNSHTLQASLGERILIYFLQKQRVTQ